MKETIPYKLIAKFLAGQCVEMEQNELMLWRTTSPENEQIFTELRNELELLNNDLEGDVIIPNKEKVWASINQIIHKPVISYSRSVLIRVASIAAMIALVVGIGFSYLLTTSSDATNLSSTFIAPEGQKSQLILADGTKVWLNSGSSLTYSNSFGGSNRTVELKGEAFFDVTKKANKKFIVKTGTVNVVVYGTAFNVKSYTIDQETSVSLVRGKVEIVSNKKNTTLATLKPGERIIVGNNNSSYKVEKCDTDMDGIWRLEKLKFEGATINEVASKLGKWYGVSIAVNDTNRFQKYWFTVKKESLAEILESMNGLHPIQYTITDKQVSISSK